ncbi:hypothetical protein VSS86_20295, partial [Bacillus safensis]|uniref:hypothetical protein n=1 Tax=Bacillus safensis TaxID=561879 RepID=UPI002DD42F89
MSLAAPTASATGSLLGAGSPAHERAPKRRVSPERIAAALTLVALFVASGVALAGIDLSLPKMLESWG